MDEIDTAFSDILSRVESITGRGTASFGSSDLFNPFNINPFSPNLPGLGSSSRSNNNNDYSGLLQRIRTIVLKVVRLLGDLHREGLGDEAVAIKQNVIDLASSVPWFDNMFLPGRSHGNAPMDQRKLEKRIEDLDSLVARLEKKTTEYSSLSPAEKERTREANQMDLNNLNLQHSKLSKKCFYLRNRIEYLLNELHSSTGRSSKNLVDRLNVWKKFIENNEYILNQRLVREERETLYSFLRNKLRDVSPDLREAEEVVFD